MLPGLCPGSRLTQRLVSATAVEAGRPWGAARRRLSAALWRRPWLRAIGLLLPPLGWMVVFYLAALAVLFVSAFWTLDPFTTKVVHHWNVDNFHEILTASSWRRVILRTVGIAAGVTVTDAIVAFPFAYFMARLAGPRLR